MSKQDIIDDHLELNKDAQNKSFLKKIKDKSCSDSYARKLATKLCFDELTSLSLDELIQYHV